MRKKLYEKLYPSSSRPGLYFSLAKVHKLKEGDTVDDLPLRPVISNIGTATYQLSKHLAEILKPLTKSEYNIESTKDFIAKIKGKTIPEDFELVSFDVVSLFTKVPLEFTINLILDRIYRDKEINTKLNREEMKKLLYLCTKEMHFSYNEKLYRQIDGVAMGSPLGPVLANIFMVYLENSLVPQLDDVSLWYRYVDDTFTFIRKGKAEEVQRKLNEFHESIDFTFEREKEGVISFLDVLVITKEDRSFDTDVYRKKTDTNLYINWEAFAPKVWKIGTLKGLIRRAFTICSTEEFLNKEIAFLTNVFKKQNGYPSRIIHDSIHSVRRKIEEERAASENPDDISIRVPDTNVTGTSNPPDSESEESSSIIQEGSSGASDAFSASDGFGGSDAHATATVPQSSSVLIEGNESEQGSSISAPPAVENDNTPIIVKPYIVLPYKGKDGERILSSFRDALKKALPENVVPQFSYKGNKVGSYFRLKDKVPVEHQSDNVYQFKDLYVGETGVRNGERRYEHIETDKNSAIFKYCRQNQLQATNDDFKILDSGYSNKLNRKLAEALYIKELKPALNEQKKSYKLCLFN